MEWMQTKTTKESLVSSCNKLVGESKNLVYHFNLDLSKLISSALMYPVTAPLSHEDFDPHILATSYVYFLKSDAFNVFKTYSESIEQGKLTAVAIIDTMANAEKVRWNIFILKARVLNKRLLAGAFRDARRD